MNIIMYEVVYLDSDGVHHETNLESKSFFTSKMACDLKIGNWLQFDTVSIQCYEAIYNGRYKRISYQLVYEVKIDQNI